MEIPHIRPDESDKAEAAEAAALGRGRGGPVFAVIRHRWPEYLIEIVVIVFSISISFAFDQWKERRHEREVEKLYLKTLSNNLISDMDALGDVIPETQLVIRKAQALRAASLTPPSGAAVATGSFEEDIRDIARRPSFFAHDAAFSDLKSSGNLRVLHDFKLKNALFDYYGQYESIKAKEASERESLITLIAPNLIKTISFGDGASTKEPGAAAIPHDRVFANSMWIRILERSELLADYERELRLAGSIQKRIQHNLD